MLFNIVIQEIFKELKWKSKGIDINWKKLSNIRFADDVVLLAGTRGELEEMIQELNEEGVKAGLEISMEKTKTIANVEYRENIKIERKSIEKVEDVIYLGQIISFVDGRGKKVTRRINLSWKKYWSLKKVR